MAVLIVDNYDSFTYNLAQYVGEAGERPVVYRNDALGIDDIERLRPSHIILSPGPGTPDSAGITVNVIEHFWDSTPILGVCLGHQAIGQVFGGRVVHAPTLMHGKVSDVYHDGTGLHHGLPTPFRATRYHSLVLRPDSVPDVFRINAWTAHGDVMGIAHRDRPLFGVQYHPESYMTSEGRRIVEAFLATGASR